MDVGISTVARLAREDTQWFVVGVVILSLVLFLALPLSVLIVIDTMKVRAEIRYEIRQLKKLKQEVERERHERATRDVVEQTKGEADR